MSDRETRALANELARLRRRLDRFETTQQSWARSVEEAAVDFYDENDLLRLSVGRQDDGSYGVRYPEGEAPPQPSEPDVVALGSGLVVVTWDGRFEERFPAAEFRNLRVHIDEGDPAFIPTRSNQVGAIWARRGGSIVALTDSDVDNPVYVKFVATNMAGQWSPESVAVLVDELDSEGYEGDEEELQWENGDGLTLTQADLDAGTVTFTLSHFPENEAVLAWWHPGGLAYAGVPQKPPGYTINYDAPSVTWPLTGGEQVGDRLRVYYPYYEFGKVAGAVTIQMIANDHTDTLKLTFILPDGLRYEVPGVNTSGAGPVVEFGYFVLDDMNMEFQNVSLGITATYPAPDHIRRTAISGSDTRGAYTGYRYEFEDRPVGNASRDGDYNDIIMDVKAYT